MFQSFNCTVKNIYLILKLTTEFVKTKLIALIANLGCAGLEDTAFGYVGINTIKTL